MNLIKINILNRTACTGMHCGCLFKYISGRGLARMKGAAVSKGDVIVFVDTLAEVNVDWLSPLLVQILRVRKIFFCWV